MDPLTIAGTAAGIGKLVYSCSTGLSSFISQSKDVDLTVQALYGETNMLGESAAAVETILARPGLEAFQDAELWPKAQACLDACSVSLRRLHKSFRGLDEKNNTVLAKGYAQVKLDMKKEDIRKMREQLQSHRLALLTISAMINVHISSAAPALVLDNVVPRLDTLEHLITSLLDRNQRVQRQPEQDDHESMILLANQRLAETAQSLVDEVNTVVGDTRSTIFGFTPSEIATAPRQAYTVGVSRRERPNTGLSGATLLESEDAEYEPVSHWIESNVSEPEQPSETTLLSLQGSSHDYRLLALSNLDAIDGDSDDDFEVELTAKYIDLANIAEREEDHDRVIGYIRLAQPRFYRRLATPVRDADIQRMEARSLVKSGRLPEARLLCEKLVRCKITDDAVRASVLEASFLLAQINFQEGSLDQARNLCLQVIKGRRRLQPQDDAHLSAVALMILVSRAQGQSLEAEALEALLPATYVRPPFNVPRPDSVRPKNMTESMSGVNTAGPTGSIAHDAEDYPAKLEDLKSKYSNVKRHYFEQKTQLEHSNKTVADQKKQLERLERLLQENQSGAYEKFLSRRDAIEPWRPLDGHPD